MSTQSVREATEADLPALVRLLVEDQIGTTRDHWSEPLDPRYGEAFRAIEATPGHSILVLEQAGEIIGCLQLMVLPHLIHLGRSRAQVEGVRIASAHRGRGHGHRLMASAIERAKAAGAVVLQLTTNAVREDAQRFYADLGFVASHVGMKLDLAD